MFNFQPDLFAVVSSDVSPLQAKEHLHKPLFHHQHAGALTDIGVTLYLDCCDSCYGEHGSIVLSLPLGNPDSSSIEQTQEIGLLD